ncbi:hypothetical protein [Spirosoma flavus]
MDVRAFSDTLKGTDRLWLSELRQQLTIRQLRQPEPVGAVYSDSKMLYGTLLRYKQNFPKV